MFFISHCTLFDTRGFVLDGIRETLTQKETIDHDSKLGGEVQITLFISHLTADLRWRPSDGPGVGKPI